LGRLYSDSPGWFRSPGTLTCALEWGFDYWFQEHAANNHRCFEEPNRRVPGTSGKIFQPLHPLPASASSLSDLRNQSEKVTGQGQILTLLKANSRSIARKRGEICTVQTLLQPISFKSDRLLGCLRLKAAHRARTASLASVSGRLQHLCVPLRANSSAIGLAQDMQSAHKPPCHHFAVR
jgi:hypothetical protein